MDGRQPMILQLRYSEIEWLALERMARQKRMVGCACAPYDEGSLKHFRIFLNGSLHRMAKSIKDQGLIVPDHNIERPFNRFQISGDIMTELEAMAAQLNTPVTRMISRLVIHPLLREYFDQNGLAATQPSEPAQQCRL